MQLKGAYKAPKLGLGQTSRITNNQDEVSSETKKVVCHQGRDWILLSCPDFCVVFVHLRAWQAVLGLKLPPPSRSLSDGLWMWTQAWDALRLARREWTPGQWLMAGWTGVCVGAIMVQG